MLNGLTSIGIFLVVQLVAAVWWASAMNTKMNFVIGIKKNLDEHVTYGMNTFSTKAEVAQALINYEKEIATALGFANKELSAMWKRIDELKTGGLSR